MKRISKSCIIIIMIITVVFFNGCENQNDNANPQVEILMNDGRIIRLELFPDIAPITVDNFLKLVDEEYYTNTVFHRIISNFMIQAGMLAYNGSELLHKPSQPSIKGEFTNNGHENNLKHEPGVISMARTNQPDSASSQFFICSATSPHLDGEYAAFGKTLDEESNQVIMDLSFHETETFNGVQNFPITANGDFVIISSITRIRSIKEVLKLGQAFIING